MADEKGFRQPKYPRDFDLIDDLKPTELLVLIFMGQFTDRHGENAFPSVGTLMWETRLGERSVQGILKSLVAKGYLKVQFKGGGRLSTTYAFNFLDAPRRPPRRVRSLDGKKTTQGYPCRICRVHFVQASGSVCDSCKSGQMILETTPAKSAGVAPQNLRPTPAKSAGVAPQNLRPTPAKSAGESYPITEEPEGLHITPPPDIMTTNDDNPRLDRGRGIFQLYHDEFGKLTTGIKEELNQLMDKHGVGEVEKAMRLALGAGDDKRTLNYVKGVLRKQGQRGRLAARPDPTAGNRDGPEKYALQGDVQTVRLDKLVGRREARELWETVREQTRENIPSSAYVTWFQDAEGVGLSEGLLLVKVENESQANWINTRTYQLVRRLVRKADPSIVDVKFVLVSYD